jgi:hypothetical protein
VGREKKNKKKNTKKEREKRGERETPQIIYGG